MRRSLLATFSFIAALLLGLTGCSDPDSKEGPTVEVSPDTIILDVRTPQEYSAGHLEGAHSVDFNGGEVVELIPHLDPEAEYLVYCRSGNRSGQAIALMEQAGFTNLKNLGSLEQASEATKLAIISDQ